MDWTYPDVAKMIDHSLLQPMLTQAQLDEGCQLAAAYQVASVCILPYWVSRAKAHLEGTGVHVSTTIGFPHGGHVADIKIREAERAISDGATELDMVVNISAVKSGDWSLVQTDISGVLHACRTSRARLKVIFENAYLKDDEKVRLCQICGDLGVDWVKTSTGYAPTGATAEDIKLMRTHSPAYVQVKAAGGIRTLDTLLEMRALGCTRCGASATAAICNEARVRLGLEEISMADTAPSGY